MVKEVIIAHDQFGQEINDGDFITFPDSSGSKLWMNIAVVDDVANGTGFLTKKISPSLQVRILTTVIDWSGSTEYEKVKLKKSRIKQVVNVTVIEKSMLENSGNDSHKAFLKLLEE